MKLLFTMAKRKQWLSLDLNENNFRVLETLNGIRLSNQIIEMR